MRIVPSAPPETAFLPPARKARLYVPPVCPSSFRSSLPVATSHRRTVGSRSP